MGINRTYEMTNRFLILIAFFVLTNCSDEKDPNSKTDISENSTDTINYANFNFYKIIAFATVNPFDPNYLYGQKKMNLSDFGDTISRTLNQSQAVQLINILNGKTEMDGEIESAHCHNPRHNIAFLNDKDSVLHYVSVCFECRSIISTKPQKGSFISFEDFFNSIGLKVFDRADHYKVYYDSVNKLRPNRKPILAKDSVIKFVAPVEKDK